MADLGKKTSVPDSSGTSAGLCATKKGQKSNEINHVPDVPDSKLTPFMRTHACARANKRANFHRLTDTSPGTSGTSGTSLFFIEKMERKAAQ